MRVNEKPSSSKDCYTLLADDSSLFANSTGFYKPFKAHIVLNVILNGGIVFSDNQTICSRNLRMLARDDGLIQELFKQGQFGVALRQGFKEDAPEEMVSMAILHDAFVKEGKIRHAETDFEKSGELLFIEQHARRVPWSYDAVRTNYTDTCQAVLLNEFRPILNDTHYAVFGSLISEERERDKGLGREFLQNRLGQQMAAAGMIIDDGIRKKLQSCTDAPYVSNLPKTIGLDPIYSEEHRASFELVRGRKAQFEDIDDPDDVEMRLDHAHFIEGLTWLDVDDVAFLQHCGERRHYLKVLGLMAEDAKHFDDLEEAFKALNLRIEDRIIRRMPGLKSHSPSGARRRFRKQVAVAIDNGSAVGMDVLGLTVEAVGCALPPGLGIASKLLLDVVKTRIEGLEDESAMADWARREIQRDRLAAYLKGKQADSRMSFEMATTSSFEKEIIVS